MTTASYLSAPTDPAHGRVAPRQLDIEADTALGGVGIHSSTTPKIAIGIHSSTGPKDAVGIHSSTAPKKSVGIHSSTASFKRIDTRRASLGIAVARLCSAAQIHPNTYREIRIGNCVAKSATIERLMGALDRLAAGAVVDEQRTLCLALLRMIQGQLADRTGWDRQVILSQDLKNQRPNDPLYVQAARLRRCAVYLLAEGLMIGKAALGHALGISRQAVHKTVSEIEAERDTSPEFDALMQSMMDLVKG
ncbi:hypothetical protein IP86_03075 [Rhodopseudomonas sp. AAP120]|nr:hypothetical protein IP86_03075 [Rhodopseudomonas sp. AAP120]